MLITYNWLKDYVDLTADAEELAHKLTMCGLEVEDLRDRYAYLDTVLAGQITRVEDHPQADHLKICSVNTGDKELQVVCGAPNAAVGLVSAMALTGTTLPSGDVIKDVEIRGVKSSGMLCSEAELIIGPDASIIMELPADIEIGTGLKQALNLSDWVMEIGVTPNRPDALSILGVAREVAGLYNLKLKYPEIKITESSPPANVQTSVQIQAPELCPRYVGMVINDVKIGPAPFWMVDRLAGVGVRSINSIVDITNFVLMETGQPLHAFDLHRLEEERIVVKTASEGERFTTLDDESRIMTSETLMICDGKKPVAMAGVMGGLNSEIEESTTDVLLESAYFNPVSIRKTAKKQGLSTEASFRFERGIDPVGCAYSAQRAAMLMAEITGGKVAAGMIDENPIPYEKVVIPFSASKCNAFLGTDVSADDMVGAMTGIDFKITGDGDDFQVEVPPFRPDLTREVDLFEEVARLVGYDQIPMSIPIKRGESEPESLSMKIRGTASETLAGMGMTEAINYSFISSDFCDKLGLPENDIRRSTVRILNPMTEEQALMRTTLVPGMLDVLRRNQSFQVMNLELFEIGKIYINREDQELPDERFAIGGLLAGERVDSAWQNKAEPFDFFDLKGIVQDLLDEIYVTDYKFVKSDIPVYYDQGAAARVVTGDLTLGYMGRVRHETSEEFSLKEAPFLFELDVENIIEAKAGVKKYQSLPRYPGTSRDLAMILDSSVEAGQVLEFLRNLEEELLTEVNLFDVYEGKQLEKDKKSLAFSFLYRSTERTLTDDEANEAHDQVTEKTLKKFSAQIRK